MDPNIAFTEVHDPTKRRMLVVGVANVREPVFSPDGKLVAYTSNENGIWEVVVTRFPSGDGKWQVTRGGGTDAHWNADGSRIAFVHGNSIYEVDVFRDPIRASPPRLVFKGDPLDLILGQGFDLSGDRFLAIREIRADRNEEAVVLVDDWATAAASR
jgi:dipeptidyl aminopeptidase/acylaminoacyl peptidase